MSGLSGKSGNRGNEYVGIQVQTSLKGVPIPRGWGTFQADCNLIDYVNFNASPNGSGGKGSGGKGGGGGKGSGTTYTYTANVLLGIVAQQIYGIRAIWKDSDVLIDGTSSSSSLPAPFRQAVFSLANYQSSSGSTVTSTSSSVTTSALAQAGLSLATGAIGQNPCSATSSYNATTYWMYNANQTAVYDGTSHALGYSGLAYVYASNYQLNSGATIPNHSFEVQTLTRQVIAGVTQDDANPADIVNDLLPSLPQWPSGIIGSTTNFQTYCLAAGLLISPLADSQRSGADLLNEILACSNTNVVWSQGQLQFVPYGDTAITGNGVTYTPNLTPVYALGWSDILGGDGDDPIKWEIRPQAQCYNYVQIGYEDRTNQYVSDVMPAQDPANIAQYGLNKQDVVSLNSIKLPSVAAQVAQLMVQRTANIRRTCTFKLPWTFGLLDPMDLITVPLRNGGTQLVRIIEADEKNDEITITAEEMLVGAAHAAQYTRQTSIAFGTNMNVNPGSAGTPLVIHPPAALVNDNEVWIAACSNYDLWGGAVVWVSTDGTNYNPVGTLRGSSAMGVLTANLATYGGSNPDTGHTLSVNMSMSAVALQTVTATDAANGVTLAIIDNELVTFKTATLTAINQYNLTNLYRGFGGTTAAAHTTGTPIVFLHGQLFKYAFDATQLGQTLYFKLQSFNLYGSGYQNLAACTAYSITLAQTYSNDVAWATQITGIPANVDALTGTEPIQNSLLPAPGFNRVPMSQFEAGTTPWYISAYGSTYGGALTVAASGAYQDLVFNCTFTGTGQYQSIVGGAFPVTAGEQLAIQSRISTNGNCTVVMCLAFSTGAVPQVLPTAGISTPADYLFQGMYTAPTGATTAQLVAVVYSTGASAARFTLSQPMVAGVPTGQTVYPAFSPGPNAFNGADVTSANTANNTNNVGTITAGSVASTINSGGGVATNQVTTSAITANAVSNISSASASNIAWTDGLNAGTSNHTLASVTYTPSSTSSNVLVTISVTGFAFLTNKSLVSSGTSLVVTETNSGRQFFISTPGSSYINTVTGQILFTGLSASQTFTVTGTVSGGGSSTNSGSGNVSYVVITVLELKK